MRIAWQFEQPRAVCDLLTQPIWMFPSFYGQVGLLSRFIGKRLTKKGIFFGRISVIMSTSSVILGVFLIGLKNSLV